MSPAIEGVLLTGGASRRMGTDKAQIVIDGTPMAVRIAMTLSKRCERVTVLGRTPIEGFGFLADAEEYAGPLVALSRFETALDFLFVASCDLVCFEAGLVDDLLDRLGEHEAVVPVLDGRAQPLCGVYRSRTLTRLKELAPAGERRIMAWTSCIDALEVPAEELAHGRACRSVNTAEELGMRPAARSDGVME